MKKQFLLFILLLSQSLILFSQPEKNKPDNNKETKKEIDANRYGDKKRPSNEAQNQMLKELEHDDHGKHDLDRSRTFEKQTNNLNQPSNQNLKKIIFPPKGMAYQNCEAAALQPPFDLTNIIRNDEVIILKTVKSPIYIKVIQPPRDGEFIFFSWGNNKLMPLEYQEGQCFIINPNGGTQVNFEVRTESEKLKIISSQLNPDNQESTNWCRLINVRVYPNDPKKRHTIKFVIWKVKT